MMAAPLDAVLDAFDAGPDAHMTSPASADDLRRVEERLGHALPASLCTLLLRVGGGLLAQGHEVFGPSRVMVHDIELVPDLLSVHARMTAEGRLDGSLVPFHRLGDVVHAMRVTGPAAGQVVSIPPGQVYEDLSDFLERVVWHASAKTRPPER